MAHNFTKMNIKGGLNTPQLEKDLHGMRDASPLMAQDSSGSSAEDGQIGAFSVDQSAMNPDVSQLLNSFNATVKKSMTRSQAKKSRGK